MKSAKPKLLTGRHGLMLAVAFATFTASEQAQAQAAHSGCNPPSSDTPPCASPVPSLDIVASPVSAFSPDKDSDHDHLKRSLGEFEFLHFHLPPVGRRFG
jgi:hypothetical protein